jgi:hypothetical protein
MKKKSCYGFMLGSFGTFNRVRQTPFIPNCFLGHSWGTFPVDVGLISLLA